MARYERELNLGELQADVEQAAIVQKLDVMCNDLGKRSVWKPPSRSILMRLFSGSSATASVPGMYLWGGVGRGKTHLCDLFYDSLPFDDKLRLHFHRFMQRVHADLKELGEIEEPLTLIADKWAVSARLLLLDEIHVHDITDAMLLGGLLAELFKRGVTLVTTSNVPPDGLYKGGLQRDRFLPAIAQIKAHTDVIEMGGSTDYRLRLLQTEPIYLVGSFSEGRADQATRQLMQNHFDRLCRHEQESQSAITINRREIPVIRRAGDLVWFTFDTLCNTPRSTQDYIEIATLFHTVMISDVPMLNDNRNDAARRLVNLVDEFYDRSIKVVLSAQQEPDSLYTGKRLAFEFVRAASRLNEMQTSEYLAAERT